MILPHHRSSGGSEKGAEKGKPRAIWPKIHETAFIAPSADVIGDVEIGEHSSVWFQVVIRGDVHSIRIGNRTNIQDLSVLHCTRKVSPLSIGNEVTVGHRATLHGCTIGNRVLVGMGAIVLDNAIVSDDCIIGAGALVTKGTLVPTKSLILGSPAKVVRALKPEELAFLKKSAESYVSDAAEYRGYVPGPATHGRNNSDLEDLGPDDVGTEELALRAGSTEHISDDEEGGEGQ